MSIIVSVDPGVQNLGLAIIKPESLNIIYTELYNVKTYPDVFNWFREIITIYKPDRVAIEKPFFTAKTIGKNTATLEIIGIIKLICQLENINYEVYPPTTIKKQITGSGKASKELVIEKIQDIFKFSTDISHIADALGVAYTDIQLSNNSIK